MDQLKSSLMACTSGMDENNSNVLHNNLDKFEHFKPLSVYARMNADNQMPGLPFLPPLATSFFGLQPKKETNGITAKRKFDDSCPDEGYDTPAKKLCSSETFSPGVLSPDLGICLMDYTSPLARQDFASPFVFSKPAQKTQAMRCDIKQSVSSPPQPQQVGSAPSAKPGVLKRTVLNRLDCNKLPSKVAPALDWPVNALCLSPLGTLTAGEFSEDDNKENCSSPGVGTHQNRPNLRITVQVSGRGDGHVVKEGIKKDLDLKVKEEEGDRAQQAVLSGLCVSAISDTPLPESANSSLNISEADNEQESTIGLPMFESTVCHNVEAGPNDSLEQSRPQVPIQECQTTLGGAETSANTSYEATLLQVQVKSVVVVVPNQCLPSSKPAVSPLPEVTAQPVKPGLRESKDSQSARTVISRRMGDMEKYKQIYIDAVNNHFKEKPTDVMAELRTLMVHVAEQTPGTDSSEWQHPADFSRRNYQSRFGNMKPALALNDWQEKNHKSDKRFANVPKIFQRSPVVLS